MNRKQGLATKRSSRHSGQLALGPQRVEGGCPTLIGEFGILPPDSLATAASFAGH